MKIRDDIAELLHQGLSNAEISRRLHCDAKAVAKARTALGLPPHRPGKTPATGVEELFHARTEPIEGGHLRWTGHISRSGVTGVRFAGTFHTASQVAFRIAHGRDPEGYCLTECDYPGCVAPAHVDDEATRTRNRAAYAAITGQDSPAVACRRGHRAAEHRRYTPSGRPYCTACNAITRGGAG
jgi:hypothetical protein